LLSNSIYFSGVANPPPPGRRNQAGSAWSGFGAKHDSDESGGIMAKWELPIQLCSFGTCIELNYPKLELRVYNTLFDLPNFMIFLSFANYFATLSALGLVPDDSPGVLAST
jgi:hypothetical protein